MEKETSASQSAQRRTERVLVQIPIEVNGKDAEGRVFRETTRTVVLNRDGARIALRHTIRVGAQVSIKNLQNQKISSFRVVDRVDKTIGLDPEWGVACVDPREDFWGILFPKKEAGQPPAEIVDVLLECTLCRTRELARLPLPSYRKLVEKSLLSLKCAHCGEVTDWRLSFIEEDAEGAIGAPAKKEKTRLRPAAVERRRAKRLTVKLPLRLRTAANVEEITRTENLSKSGVCFYSKLQIMTGEEIRVTVGYAPGSPSNELRAKVMWGRAVGGDEQFLYGVELKEIS